MKTKKLNVINSGPEGVGLSVDFMNSIIDRVEDLIQQVELNRPIAGEGIQISYTPRGAIISLDQ
jgi:hypothetical protein